MKRLLASMLVEQAPTPKPAPIQTPAPADITVTVLGAVPKPGKFTLPNGATLPMAIGRAGRFTKTANAQKVSVIPANDPKSQGTVFDVRAILKKTAKDVVLKNGDTIRVVHQSWAGAPGK
jgi:protein involved in polysaccharide export with SLBB domain